MSRFCNGWITRKLQNHAAGGKWLDVRLPSEFQNFRIDEAVNIPLYFIRLETQRAR